MTENQEPQDSAYGEQQAEFSDASEPAAQQTTPSGAEAYGEQETDAEGTGQSDQETVEQTQGGFYSDENVEDDLDENL